MIAPDAASAALPGAPLATLPMYDWPEIRDAVDAFWAGWRDRLHARDVDAPEALDRNDDVMVAWRDPRLLVGQTCGRPYANGLESVVRLVATPCYAAEGCEGPFYASWIVARADAPERPLAELAAPLVAVNGYDSHSGWGSLRRVAPELGLDLSRSVVTGAHRLSARAVAEGEADLAAIDAVSLHLLERHEPQTTSRLRRVARTAPAPGTPFITAAGTDDATLAAIRAALDDALAAPALVEARATLALVDAKRLDAEAYRPMAPAFDPPAPRG